LAGKSKQNYITNTFLKRVYTSICNHHQSTEICSILHGWQKQLGEMQHAFHLWDR